MSSSTEFIANAIICPPASDDDLDQHRLITKRQLLLVTSRSYSAIWEDMRRGTFPVSVRCGSRVYWRWSEVKQWLDELPRSEYRGVEEPGKPDGGVGR